MNHPTTEDAKDMDPSVGFAYWNTPDEMGVTRRQRKYAQKVGIPAKVTVLAALPCLGGLGNGPCCVAGSCVTCEARRTLADNGESEDER